MGVPLTCVWTLLLHLPTVSGQYLKSSGVSAVEDALSQFCVKVIAQKFAKFIYNLLAISLVRAKSNVMRFRHNVMIFHTDFKACTFILKTSALAQCLASGLYKLTLLHGKKN